jgi:hypothetical protein
MPEAKKPVELVRAMAAIKSACSVVSIELADNPEGDKPTGLSKGVKMGDLYDILKELYGAVNHITSYLTNIGHGAKLSKLEEKVMDLESDKDAMAQKWKVGTLIIQSNNKANNPKVKPEKEVKKEDLTSHAAELIKMKTGVEIEENDLSKIHFVPGGALKVKFHDTKYSSKFKKIVTAIKKPTNDQKALNLFINFELTKMRNNLLFEVRKAKRENRIAKYFVDFDGTMSVLVNLSDSVTVRLTRLSGVMEPRVGGGAEGYKSRQPARTFTAEAFRQFMSPQV